MNMAALGVKIEHEEMLGLVAIARSGLEAAKELADAGERAEEGDRLPAKDRRRLVRAVADGRRALDRIVVSVIPFLWKRARKWMRLDPTVPPEDLVQDGVLGIIDAIPKFDPSNGAEFMTYATHDINKRMRGRMADSMTPFSGGQAIRRYIVSGGFNRDVKRLEDRGLDDEQVVHALAAMYGSLPDTIRAIPNLRKNAMGSLDAPVPGSETITLHELVADEETLPTDEHAADTELRALIKKRLARVHLSERERLILNERLLNPDPPTLKEIGDRFGLCRERIRQIESALLLRLRHLFVDLAEARRA